MTTQPKKSYVTLRAELDNMLEWFESDDLDVDEAIVNYEKAIKLAKELEDYLTKAENKLVELKAALPKL